MSEEEQKIENMKTPFGAVVLSLLDGKPYIIRKGNFGLCDSSELQHPLRKPVEIDGQLLRWR
ncbi:MAG: hypothetical protein R3D26_10940 [Cyanobacteriota/Melainabacteria group bacterium]